MLLEKVYHWRRRGGGREWRGGPRPRGAQEPELIRRKLRGLGVENVSSLGDEAR